VLNVKPELPLKNPKQSQVVRFNVDGNDCIIEDVHFYQKAPKEYYAELHTTKEEERNIKVELRSSAIRFLLTKSAKVKDMIKLYEDCEKNADTFPSRNEVFAYRNWADSEARGLEEHLSRQFKLERSDVIDIVLDYQDYLQHLGLPPTEAQSLLSRRYASIAQRSRAFALRMALADSLVVY
jgi:hypothetical protein